jgi:hypothetical protein
MPESEPGLNENLFLPKSFSGLKDKERKSNANKSMKNAN